MFRIDVLASKQGAIGLLYVESRRYNMYGAWGMETAKSEARHRADLDGLQHVRIVEAVEVAQHD